MAGEKWVVLIATLDTKGPECQFVKEIIEEKGLKAMVIDAGVKGDPYFKADIGRDEVAKKGGEDLASLLAKDDRGHAITVMSQGAEKVVKELYSQGKLNGIISMGGSAGTTIGTTAMRALPYAIPKVMVSTLASGDTKPFVGTKDIMMLNSVVDVAGLNKILKSILTNAALAITGMVADDEKVKNIAGQKPLIAASMFGVTTPCVEEAKKHLEEKGFEVLVFHATGIGGRTMEELISEGHIVGVLDITTTELADELVGGVLSAGQDRLTAAAKAGIPQVVSTGALDMVNFGPYDTVPNEFLDRKLYKHNENVTLMRTNKEENRLLGNILAQKLNHSVPEKTEVFLPLKGVSLIDAEGQPFYGPEEDKILFAELKENLKSDIPVQQISANINDKEFARKMAERLLELIAKNEGE